MDMLPGGKDRKDIESDVLESAVLIDRTQVQNGSLVYFQAFRLGHYILSVSSSTIPLLFERLLYLILTKVFELMGGGDLLSILIEGVVFEEDFEVSNCGGGLLFDTLFFIWSLEFLLLVPRVFIFLENPCYRTMRVIHRNSK